MSLFIRIMAYVLFWCKNRLPLMYTGVSIEHRRIPTAEPLTLHVMLLVCYFTCLSTVGIRRCEIMAFFHFHRWKASLKPRLLFPPYAKYASLKLYIFHILWIWTICGEITTLCHTHLTYMLTCVAVAWHSKLRIHVTASEDCVVVRGILSYAYM